MGDKLEVKIVTRSGMTHMLTITEEEYEKLMLLIKGDRWYIEIKKNTGHLGFTKYSIETIEVYK